MPFTRLPLDLQARFPKKGSEIVLDLSNYPLDGLTPNEFTALVKVLRSNRFLTHLYLENCGLAQLKVGDLNNLLSGLNRLVALNLYNNQLSHSSESLKSAYQALHSLPRFYFLSIGEEKQHQRAPEFFSGLRTLPAFRMFKEGRFISFLKGTEIDALFGFMEKKIRYIPYYFSKPYLLPDTNLSKNPYERFICQHPSIQKAHTYRVERIENPVVIPHQTLKALQFFDQLEGMGVALRYCTKTKVFILNLQKTTDASCARVAFILQQRLPDDIRWHLELPNRPVSHFVMDIFWGMKKKYPNLKIISTAECALKKPKLINESTQDYVCLKLLNDSFVQSNEQFYELLHNEDRLFQLFDRLKSILESDNQELKNLVYEFFVANGLCHLPGIIENLASLKKEVASQLEANLKPKILLLLNSDGQAVAEQLSLPEKDKITTEQSEEAQARTALHARAWWGMAAFYQINQNSSMGAYWYGRCLQEYPYSTTSLPITLTEPQTFSAEKSGLYWLRLAAIHYHNHQAFSYLNELLPKQKDLSPPERYQLLLAAEELQLPLLKSGAFIPYQHFFMLFPERGFFARMKDISEEAASNSEFVGFVDLTSRFLRVDPNLDWVIGASLDFIARSMSAPSLREKRYSDFFLREQEFYISSLMADSLITEQTKVNLFKTLLAARDEVIRSVELTSVRDLKRARTKLINYHKIPLGTQLESQVLPILEGFLKKDVTYELNSQKSMRHNPRELRVAVFCQFFKEHLEHYLKHRKLFNVDIAKNESPSYVAALIHSLLNYSLDYFELDNIELKTVLNQVMQGIKKDLQDNLFRQNLASHPNSFGFQEAMTKRLISYSTTGYVANAAKLSPLRKFGELQKGDDHHDEDWLKKGLHTSALAIEAVHVAVPVILAVTGAGIPAALGSSAVFEGLRVALEQIHHYAHLTEETLHKYQGATDIIVKLTHMYHLAHESGLNSHGHSDSKSKIRVEFDTIQHLNNLLSSAAVNDIDIIPVLMRHWAAVYKPITDELTETSNTLLGILLVELLMRSLAVRLLSEQQSVFKKRVELPKSISELLDYFNETLWLYCRPNMSDEAQLLTKKRQVCSALDIIFPRKLKVYFAGEVIEVDLKPKNIPSRMPLTRDGSLCRFASNYEVKQLNAIRNGHSKNALGLVGGGHVLFGEWQNLEIVIAYQESKTLDGKIALLSNKAELLQLKDSVQDCINYNNFIMMLFLIAVYRSIQ